MKLAIVIAVALLAFPCQADTFWPCANQYGWMVTRLPDGKYHLYSGRGKYPIGQPIYSMPYSSKHPIVGWNYRFTLAQTKVYLGMP